MTTPARVEDLTPEWFSEIPDSPVGGVEILDAHSGTTGRARVRLTASSDVPDTLFVNCSRSSNNNESSCGRSASGWRRPACTPPWAMSFRCERPACGTPTLTRPRAHS